MLADSEMIQKLLNSDLSGWKIEKETGVSRNAILEMRHGRREVKNLRLDTAIKLTTYACKTLKKGDENA